MRSGVEARSGKFRWRDGEMPESLQALYAKHTEVYAELAEAYARVRRLEVRGQSLGDLIDTIEDNEYRRRVQIEQEQDPLRITVSGSANISEESVG